MEARFQAHLDSSSTPNQPPPFASDVSPLIARGTDDATFLEESWTLGVDAAARNLHRRRQLKADQENQACAFSELQTLGTIRFIEDRQRAIESALVDRAAAIVDHYDATSSESWSPQDWTPEDQVAHSRIPQGWTPSCMPRFEASQSANWNEMGGSTMTAQRARLLLEVIPSSTREQVRSAYRRMVGQWHPDRLQLTTEAIRNYATQHMARLNEAYRLLCATEIQEAA